MVLLFLFDEDIKMTTPVLQKKLITNIQLDPKTVRPLLQLEGKPLSTVLLELAMLKERFEAEGYSNIRFSSQSTAYNLRYVLYGDRMETDKELEDRQKRANGVNSKKQQKLDEQRAKDLAELARLKAIYES